MEANTESEQTRFKSGEPLPSAKKLVALLNELSIAYEKRNKEQALRLEGEICDMVVPGIYEGYLNDDSDEIFFVRFVSTQRKDPASTRANIYSFCVTLEVLDVVNVSETREMQLVDFLRDVNREGKCGRQHKGPRFWPL